MQYLFHLLLCHLTWRVCEGGEARPEAGTGSLSRIVSDILTRSSVALEIARAGWGRMTGDLGRGPGPGSLPSPSEPGHGSTFTLPIAGKSP